MWHMCGNGMCSSMKHAKRVVDCCSVTVEMTSAAKRKPAQLARRIVVHVDGSCSPTARTQLTPHVFAILLPGIR